MFRYLLYYTIIFTIFSCKEVKKEKDIQRNTNKSEYSNEVLKDHNISAALRKTISEYSEVYSLNKDGSLPTKQSYYIGFAKLSKDTLLIIGRQPFFTDLFPDFALEYKSPAAKLEFKGLIMYKDELPLTFFDEKVPIGSIFYNSNEFIHPIPEEYQIKEIFDTLIPPYWIYKVNGSTLTYMNATDSITIK